MSVLVDPQDIPRVCDNFAADLDFHTLLEKLPDHFVVGVLLMTGLGASLVSLCYLFLSLIHI